MDEDAQRELAMLYIEGIFADQYAGMKRSSASARQAVETAGDVAQRFAGDIENARQNRAGIERRNGPGTRLSNETNPVKIMEGQTEEERAAILLEKGSFEAAVYRGQADDIISEKATDLNSRKASLVKAALKSAVDQIGLPQSVVNDDLSLRLEVSKGTFTESASKKITNKTMLVRIMPVLEEAVKNAVGIEVHVNRYLSDYNTVFFANMLGGYIDGDYFIPVRFGAKIDNRGKATLYVLICNEQINKAEVLTAPDQIQSGHAAARSASTVNISRLASLVKHEGIIKYLPDGLLSAEQKRIKWESIAATVKDTNDYNDQEYNRYLAKGNRRAIKQMVKTAAERAGYDMELYHGSKKGGGFTVFKDWQYFTPNKAYAERYMERDNPDSLYHVYVKSERMFDTRRPECREIFEQMRAEYGLSELQENGLPDWTDGYDISDFIEENGLDFDGVVLDEGGDLTEDGPVSRGVSYIIRNSEQVKSAEPVTYDENENVIPISERFRTDRSGEEAWKNRDIRFSPSEDADDSWGVDWIGKETGETDSSTPLRSAQNDKTGDGRQIAGAAEGNGGRSMSAPTEERGRQSAVPTEGGTDSSTPLRSAQNDNGVRRRRASEENPSTASRSSSPACRGGSAETGSGRKEIPALTVCRKRRYLFTPPRSP
ncbi:MAG: hypothetical protein IKI02_09205 [Oscillospiraceae bacterium]|nr:hypothetical protein [Oscillospiraceae bacterium]